MSIPRSQAEQRNWLASDILDKTRISPNVNFELALAINYDLKSEKIDGLVGNSKNSNGLIANLEKNEGGKVEDGVWNEELLRKKYVRPQQQEKNAGQLSSIHHTNKVNI